MPQGREENGSCWGGERLKVLVVPEPLHVHHIPVLLIFTSTGQLELISSG